jgi:hypothetical protein
VWKIETALFDGSIDNGTWPGTKGHTRITTEGVEVSTGDIGSDIPKRPNEVLDHAIRIGVIDVESTQLTICKQIDAGILLGFYYDGHCISQGLL